MERRTFLELTGASMLGASGPGSTPTGRAVPSTEGGRSWKTPLCERLGIEAPILQSGMGRVAGPELAAAVSAAGGLGILAGLGLSGEELRRQIRRLRELTDRPFGVNLWLHEELQSPADSAELDGARIRAVTTALDGFRERLGLAPSPPLPRAFPDTIEEAFEVLLDERVPVWSIGLGDPGPERTRRCHERGIHVMAMIATVEDAATVAASGVDSIVAQGAEAGGHRSTWVKKDSPERAAIGTLALVPQVVDAVSVPVIAAGGIADGRGLLAALALGAEGVLLGTRFVLTRESLAPNVWKKALVDSGSDRTTVTDAFTGLYARAIENRFTRDYAASGAPVLPGLLQALAASDIYRASAERDEPDYFPLMAGQSVGLLETLVGAADVVHDLLREASEALDALPRATG